jgi:WD40 repeat protein
MDREIDFFISYTPADERWAAWIAWELEAAGYTTMVQAWDFVPGTNFVDFMDRGLRSAKVTIAVLSKNYLRSRHGRQEWQAAWARTPDPVDSRLLTVRVEPCELEGLLALVTWVDLVGVVDPGQARQLLLSRIRESLRGRAKPSLPPRYPTDGDGGAAPAEVDLAAGPARRRRPVPAVAPAYPPAEPVRIGPRAEVTVLHVPGPRFDRGPDSTGDRLVAAELQGRIWVDLSRLLDAGAPAPDLVLVSGNLTRGGRPAEATEAAEFLTGLRMLLKLEPHRLAVVPGDGDVSRQACEAYFNNCAADDVPPAAPYWPKWRHFDRLFRQLYDGIEEPEFASQRPWTLFPVADLRVVVAGLNSTVKDSHLDADHYGWIGDQQAAWFAHALKPYAESAGWLRIGLVRHHPLAPTGDPDPAALRDPATLDRALGHQLNLLVCGPGPGAAEPDRLPSSLLVVPPASAAPFQLLQLSATSLTRWDEQAAVGQLRVPVRWAAVGGTFLPNGAEQPRGDVAEPGFAPQAPADPLDVTADLLGRIEEVCRTRHKPGPGVRIDRVAGPLPYIVVTYREGGRDRRWQVAAREGEPTRADIEEFRNTVQAVDPDADSELVYEAPRIGQAVLDEANQRQVRVRSFGEFQEVLHLRAYLVEQTNQLREDQRYPVDLYVPQRYRELVGTDRTIRADLVGELLRLAGDEDGRFVLVLGDFGRGKTFSLRQLALRLASDRPDLIPIFIELRSLDKAQKVDALVAAHLATRGEKQIDLDAFNYMLRQGRVVLIFDGFDELAARVTYERATEHLETLVQAAEGRAKVFVSSRTQHFKTDAQVFTALGERVGVLPHRRVINIEDFTQEQVRQYLVNFYGEESPAEDRLTLLRGAEDLVGLARNPRMLSFIARLDEQRLRTVVQARRVVSAAHLYGEVLDAWLEYEEERTRGVPGAPPSLTKAQLSAAVGQLAVRLWESNEPLLRPAEVTEIADSLTKIATTAPLSAEQAQHAVGAGSLLVRTEEGLFGFIHGSVVEWLVAREIAAELDADREPPLLALRTVSQLIIDFLCDLAETEKAQAWVDGVLADRDAADAPRRNALKISSRLKTTARTDLRGADLRAVDLSHRDLSDADLSGADLSEARLVGTKLNRANLRDAKLVGARLDETVLTGADLSGVDATRARLRRADLDDVILARSTWRQAALIHVHAGRSLLEAPELRGAAISPGQPIDVEFAPAAVGVQYGFDFGRLPMPAAYNADGGLLALGSDDGGVLIYDTVSGRPVRTLRAHGGRVYAIAYAPADRVLATASSDGTVVLWDPLSGDKLATLADHEDRVWPMTLSPDGSLLVTGDSSGTVRVWDTEHPRLLHGLGGHAEMVWTMAVSPDGSLLATGDDDGVVRLWDPRTGERRGEITGHVGAVYRVVFSPDGRLLAAADHGGQVSLWDVPSGALHARPIRHAARVYALGFDAAGTLLASGDVAGVLQLWDLAGGTAQPRPAQHSGAVYWLSFSPDGALLVSGDSNGVVQLWDPVTRQLRRRLAEHRGSSWPAAFRPDGGQLATSSNDGTVRLWDPHTGERKHLLRGHGRHITSVRFSPDSQLLATSGNDGVVRLWNTRTGRREQEFVGWADRLSSAFFNPAVQSQQLATSTNDGSIYLWNVVTGAAERDLEVGTDHVWTAEFSPDGDVIATANDDDSVRLWYRTNGRQFRVFADHRGRVRSIAFSPDGSLVATGCDDHKVRLWDPETEQCLAVLAGHTDRVYTVCFDRDGGRLLSASNDGTARLWDPRTGQPLHQVAEHTGRLWSAAFSPDGTVVATAGDDLVIRLWNAADARPLRQLTGHTRRVWSVSFSPDGQLLASGGDDGTVHVWDVSDASAARRRMTLLGLSESSWAALAPDGRYKLEGDAQGQFWHVIGMSRFEPGDLDDYVAEVRQVALAGRL